MNENGKALLAERAERELDEITDYIAERSGQQRADATVARFNKAFRTLARHPYLGRLRSDLDGSPRSFGVSSWVVFYDPLPDDAGVEIVSIIHGSRDLPRHFRRT